MPNLLSYEERTYIDYAYNSTGGSSPEGGLDADANIRNEWDKGLW